ncbi:ATP-binding protein [Ramlibacter sp. H39-3-26]|uniref:ATP-binding protein n=1 Tax=Curvibacter soli TaxID=3031331 RepID=UPI0023DBFD7C|nr:ATP-binding protein [Ramlibacter sp. H39-3-26]
MNQPAELQCALHGTVAELPAFFERLEEWADGHGVPLPLASSFGLMLDELLTNVAMHGYAGNGGPVEVRVRFDAPLSLQAVLRDRGVAFDPTALAAPDVEASLEDRGVGGLGVHFVRKLADRFVYRRDGDVNEVTLSRTWPARQAQGEADGV